MKVPLEAAALAVGRRDDAFSGRSDLGELRSGGRLEPLVLEPESRGADDLIDGRGGVENVGSVVQRRDGQTVAHDRRPMSTGGRPARRDLVAGGVDVAAVDPVEDL